ncbi:MAG: type I DNA topoisomerase [Clostridia bacterium]|nr:type I DNA topoisomerase [Clostridia bacterium]
MAYLVIVESPAKANTIKSYLGSNYKVIASKGHIRDLPKSTLGIDVENGFAPHYINIRGKGDVIKELKKEAKNATKIFLATDPDREGEAISWHIANQLGIPESRECRVTFNEITKTAVKEAIKKPRKINIDLVNSQQARRILDRLIGFNLSQILWKSVKSGLSGGRVQSVALRIVTEREAEIRAFVPQEYWTVEASLKSGDSTTNVRFYGDKNGKIKIENADFANEIESKIKGKPFRVVSVRRMEKHKLPAPPFTTSTLQQEASKKLGYQAQRIMKIAQELYDGLNLGAEFGGVQGLITYMRTDSQRVSESAQAAAIDYIRANYGEENVPETPRVYKSHAGSQDAHEAIRPANVELVPKLVKKMLTPEQYKLYKLIWERFIASQMEAALFDTVSVELENSGYIFKTGGYQIKSKGFMTVYGGEFEDTEDEFHLAGLPNIKENEELESEQIIKEQHFTEPPPRYTEASLIKFLEENGIGRPSTYAPIISIIVSRNYVKRDGKSLVATELGEVITAFMREYFPEIIDYEYTALMEANLDSIEHKENTIVGVISDFYHQFSKELEAASAAEAKVKVEPTYEESDVKCEKCGAMMIYKNGRYGKFLACPSYPACKNTKAIDKNGKVVNNEHEKQPIELADFKCEKCGADMVVRRGRFGTFYACSNYPECTFTKQKIVETGAHCPICSSKILARHGKGNTLFYSCERYPECDFSSWDMPLTENCPDCGEMLFYRKSRKVVMCKNKSCGYKRDEEMTVIE